VSAASGAVACDTAARRLHLLDQDREAASFVEKCPDWGVAIFADG
jgi:hypothetical protein